MYKYIYFLKEELDFDQEFKRGYEGILKKVDQDLIGKVWQMRK